MVEDFFSQPMFCYQENKIEKEKKTWFIEEETKKNMNQ